MLEVVPDQDPAPATPPAQSKLSDPAYVFVGDNGLRAGWGIVIFIVIWALLSGGLIVATSKILHVAPTSQKTTQSTPHLMPVAETLISEGSLCIAALFATFIMSKIERRPITRFGFGGTRRFSQFLQGFFWGIACLSLLVAILRLTGHLQFDARLLTNTEALRYGLLWFAGFMFVAVFEESLTRGYLQYTVARGVAGLFPARYANALSFWTAALFFSFIFGLGHRSNPGESPFGLVAAGLAGLVFCLALYRTGSLWWAIGFHASWDWAQSFLYGVADSGTMVQGHLYSTHPAGPAILSGGLTGPEGSVYLIPTLAVAVIAILLPLPKAAHPGETLSTPDSL